MPDRDTLEAKKQVTTTEVDVMQEQENQFPKIVKVNLLPETIALIQQAGELSTSAKLITIETPEQYQVAASEMAKIKGLFKHLDADRKSNTKPIDDLKSEVMEFYRPMLDSLNAAEALVKKAMITFDQEQEKARRIAEAAAAEKARKEQEKLNARAAKAEEKGQVEKAAALQEQAATVIAMPVHVAAAPKVSGVSTRTNYSAEVTDLRALLQAVIDGKAPINAVCADMKFLNAQAKALKDNFEGMYAGCKLLTDTSLSSRSANPF